MCLALEPEDESVFDSLVALGCGQAVDVVGLKELTRIGKVADKYGMEEVLAAVEEAALERLTIDTCGELLAESMGLSRVEEKSRAMALEAFGLFATTNGFLRVGEETLGSLLQDDKLCVESEEVILRAVIRWMTAAPSGHGKCGAAVRGEGLLQHVRFSLIESKFLSGQALVECVQGSSKLLELIRHASGISSDSSDATEGSSKRARLCRGTDCVELFMNKECVKSRWDAREQAFSIAAAGRGLVCGLWSGKIKLWKSDEQECELQLVGHARVVTAVVWWGNLIVSGSSDGRILVWNSQTGLCEAVLLGHAQGLSGLAVCGSHLLSGSDDGTVRVWGLLGPPEEWRCEQLLASGWGVRCVAAWGRTAAAGGADGVIRVWDAVAGKLEQRANRLGHSKAILSMAARGSLLVSSSEDQKIRVWCLATLTNRTVSVVWKTEQKKELVLCLALVDSKIVGGTDLGRICVWDLEKLDLICSEVLGEQSPVRMLAVDGMSVSVCWGHEVLMLAHK